MESVLNWEGVKKKKMRVFKKKLTNKYGVQFWNDFKDLETRHFWNLTDLAQKYGFSREYARQIYVFLKGEGYTKSKVRKTQKRLKNENLTCVHDPRHKVAEYKREGHNYKAVQIEKLFLKECKKRKFQIEIPCNQTVDIKINDFWVDVKSSFCTRITRPSSLIEYYVYHSKGKQVDIIDFLACYHLFEKTFFIIPAKIIKPDSCNVMNIYIAKEKSTYHNAKNRYWKYKGAWHLLEV